MSTYYSEEHEWLRVASEQSDTAEFGITAYAAEQLGDIVYVEFKEVGEQFSRSDEIGVIESFKAASDIYAPVSGQIVAANTELANDPGKINESPEGEAWLYKIKLSDPTELEHLMDEASYRESTSS